MNQNQNNGNSRNNAQNSGIGGRLNTKNNAMGSIGGKQNTHSSFSNNLASKSPQKQGNLQQANTIFINNMPQSMKNNFSGQTKISKKKMMAGSNQSLVNKSKQSFDKNALNQMSAQQSKQTNIMGLATHHNTFYGNIKQNHPQSRQQNNSLGSKGGTLSSQQSAAHPHQQSMLSKNDIIAKYVKSMNQNQQVG